MASEDQARNAGLPRGLLRRAGSGADDHSRRSGGKARGPTSLSQRLGAVRAALIEGREYATNAVHLPPDLERMAVGGAQTIIFDEVVAGRAEELSARLPDVLFSVLVPYIGPEAAAAEVRQAARD